MLDSVECTGLRNGKRYYLSVEGTMSDRGSTEENATGISSQIVDAEVSKVQTLTQEAVNKQNRRFIAPLTRQLEELTRLVQGVVTTQQPQNYPRTDLGTTSGIATHQSHRLSFDKRAIYGHLYFNSDICWPCQCSFNF